jgi:hypothetical protein
LLSLSLARSVCVCVCSHTHTHTHTHTQHTSIHNSVFLGDEQALTEASVEPGGCILLFFNAMNVSSLHDTNVSSSYDMHVSSSSYDMHRTLFRLAESEGGREGGERGREGEGKSDCLFIFNLLF